MRRETFICLILITVTLAVYWQVSNHEFVDFDDPSYVVNNPHVQERVTSESVLYAFSSYSSSLWMPLTWLSYMLDFELYGLSPGGYHLTNVFLHLANTLLLFLVLKKMTEEVWQSAFVAALFALHPLHVESVAWIAERKDVLSAFFWMLTMWAYLLYVKRPGSARYLVVVIAFALGLMAKPMLVTLPFVLLLLDYWPLGRLKSGRSLLRMVLEKTPLFVLSAIFCLVTIIAQQKGGGLRSFDDLPLSVTIPNALVSYVSYLGKMIWPQKLAVFYPHPGSSLPMWQAVAAGLLLVFISVVVVWAARRWSYLAMGWLWYLGTLVPVIGLVQTGNHSMADRYTYIPLIGLFIMVAWGVPEFVGRYRYRTVILAVAASSMLSLLIILTWSQLRIWRNTISLFEHAVSVTDNNYTAHTNLGYAFAKQGNDKKSLAHFVKAAETKPYFAKAHSNLGNALARQGREEEAVAQFYQALQINPKLPGVHNNLGNVLEGQGKLQEALSHYSIALKLEPQLAEAHFNLGAFWALQGRNEEAISHFARALELKPTFAEAHNSLGVVLARRGKLHEAIYHFSEAARLEPDFVKAHSNLKTALKQREQSEKSVRSTGTQ
jgi:Flp pilus assembly protein TadD